MHIFRRSIAKGGKDGSKGFVKRVTSTFSIKKKKNTESTSDPKPLFPRSKSTGSSNYASTRPPQEKKGLADVTSKTKRIKSAGVSPQQRRGVSPQQRRGVSPQPRLSVSSQPRRGVSPQPRREKIDESSTRKQFMKMKCFDDNDSIWLSSDCASSSSQLAERRVSASFHFSVDEKIVSWLSNVAKSSLTLNQESTKENHHHQTSSKNAKSSSEKVRKDGKVCKSRGTSPAKPSSSHLPEGTNMIWPSSSNKFVSSDSTSQSLEDKKVSFSAEPQESPLPVSSTLEKTANSKSKIVVEPLFWPLEQKFDWSPEDILNHFSMSPRRKKSGGSKSAGNSPKSMRAQLQARKPDLKEGSKRKLMFNGPGSNSKPTRIPELKRSSSANSKKNEMSKNQQPIRNVVKRNKSLPSRLRKSNKISSKVVPIEAAEETGEILKKQKIPKKLIMTRKSRTFLEDDFSLMNDFSIENAVGLCEFKGREGIDTDFNTDSFLFGDSL